MATIDKTINMSVQNSLEMLEADCKKLSKRVQKRLRDDDSARAFNSRDFGRGCLLLTLAFAPVAVVVAMLVVRLEVFDKNQVEALKVLEAVDQWVTNLTYEVIGYIVGGSVVALFLWWVSIYINQNYSCFVFYLLFIDIYVFDIGLYKKEKSAVCLRACSYEQAP